MALYFVEQVSIKPNLHNSYLDFLDHLLDSSLIGLTLQEIYRHIGLLLHAYLSSDLSFDKTIEESWPLAWSIDSCMEGVAIPASTEVLPLQDIVDYYFIVGGSSSVAFLPSPLIYAFCLCWLGFIHTFT